VAKKATAKKGAAEGASMAVQITAAPIDAPLVSASSVQLTVAGNEVTVLFFKKSPKHVSQRPDKFGC
jgi:hypothetical protein